MTDQEIVVVVIGFWSLCAGVVLAFALTAGEEREGWIAGPRERQDE